MADDPLVSKDVDENKKEFVMPAPIATPVEAALSGVGAIAQSATNQVQARGGDLTRGTRPWLEFFDLSAFGLAQHGTEEYMMRFKANFRHFLFNYLLLSLVLAGLSEITKPLPFIGCVVIIFCYFKLFGSEAQGQDEVLFLGMMLDERERAGFMLILGTIIFLLVSSGKELFIRVIMGSLLVSLVHGCLRKPHPDRIPNDWQPSSNV